VTHLLIPGAGGAASFWHRLAPLLDDAIAVDLPADDPSAGLPEYADLVVAAADGAEEVVVVAQSLGGFTALPACERLNVRHLFLLNAMVPVPGETASEWWEHTGSESARIAAARAGGYTEEIDLDTYFLHDVDPEHLVGMEERPEADAAFEAPCTFSVWPRTTVLAGVDDRFFPLEFQRRVARERVGLDVVEVPGGHCAALSRPEAIAAAIRRIPPA
jgi:pimeloyl-ACP methyl ester carboxylesterase